MSDTTKIEQPVAAVDEGWEWAIVEIFGHRRHVGKAREEEKFGAKMLRIDVPKIVSAGSELEIVGDKTSANIVPASPTVTWSSHFYGGSSIFSYTLTDERTVMRHAERSYAPAILYRDHGVDDDELFRDPDDHEDSADDIAS